MEREKRIGGFLMESESSVGENTAVVENGGSIMTPPLPAEEEAISSSKRRKTHDSEIADTKVENSATSSVVVIGGELLSGYLKSTDLKSEEFETAVSTFDTAEFSEETSLSRELFGEESVEAMDSPSSTRKKKSSSSQNFAAQMPSAAEIEEFFAVAEKSEQERFAKKYNYDIEKDVPLKGRYQWIPLKL